MFLANDNKRTNNALCPLVQLLASRLVCSSHTSTQYSSMPGQLTNDFLLYNGVQRLSI